MEAAAARGILLPLDEEAERELYQTAMDVLEAAGLRALRDLQFRPARLPQPAQPGLLGQRGLLRGRPGGGATSASAARSTRRDLDAYLRRALAGEPVTQQSEELSPEERAEETMAVQLRRAAGIDRPAFHSQTGFQLDEVASARLPHLIEQGFLHDDGQRVCLTQKGKFVADAVIERLL